MSRVYYFCRKADRWGKAQCRHRRCRRHGWFPKIEDRHV